MMKMVFEEFESGILVLARLWGKGIMKKQRGQFGQEGTGWSRKVAVEKSDPESLTAEPRKQTGFQGPMAWSQERWPACLRRGVSQGGG